MFASKDFLLTAGGAGGPTYPINNSLRFRSSASAYLNRTPSVAGNQKTWTWSSWVKRGKSGTTQMIFTAGNGTGAGADLTQFVIYFASTDVIRITGNQNIYLATSQVFRDSSAWYHIVLSVDATQSVDNNKMKLYVNGQQVTSFSTNGLGTSFTNQNYLINSTAPHYIGVSQENGSVNTAYCIDGYFAETYLIDGQQLPASSFGSFNTTTGVWQPIAYTGTYGTNGFYLKFASTGSTAALGTDSSGNSNTWTVNNISVTAGVTYDPMTDVPTLTSATVANYPVLNPLTYRTTYSHTVPTNGNLTCSSDANFRYFTATMSSAGSYYFEMTATTNAGSGSYIAIWQAENPQSGATFSGYGSDGSFLINGVAQTALATYTTGDIVAFAHNTSAGTVGIYKNGTLLTTATGVQTTLAMYPGCLCGAGSVLNMNFGQRPFTYTPPSGFVALNSYNLPAPTIANGASYMAATAYAGNSSTNNINNGTNTTTAVTFKPDFVWVKNRGNAVAHYLSNSVTGAYQVLFSNLTSAEYNGTSNSDGVSTFNSNGFTLLNGTNALNYNQTGYNYIAWQWQAGAGTSSTNTAGSITSTVSVNATAGFSVVTFTGTGANATVGHGLGVAPSMVLIKNRNNTGGAVGFVVGHVSLPWPNGYLQLYSTNAVGSAASVWNTSPTSTVVGLGTDLGTNYSGAAYVAYCWSAVAGYSAFGSYTGNGSTDGPFIYTGFRPRFILIKCTDSNINGYWMLKDNLRASPYNPQTGNLYADLANAEDTTSSGNVDFLANGFKLRGAYNGLNASSYNYIYAAFAENPFKYALAR